jgi:Na+/H+ antiporter NhaD/arsenite permease-like protein
LIALLIFAGTYFIVAIGQLPGFRIDRTGAAIIGASLMVAFNQLSLAEAWQAVDYETLILLFGMMIVVASLRLSGFFTLVAERVVEHAHGPRMLLLAVTLVSGLLSAFFVNDTICLVLTPLVLEVARRLQRNPVPYLLAVAMGANAGSVATITGNPQNMMIGSLSGIPYRVFFSALAPVALLSLVVVAAAISLIYRQEFRGHSPLLLPVKPVRLDRPLLYKSATVALAMVAAFFVGWPVAKAALIAGGALLITRRVKPEKIYRQIDWSLLVLFTGLFVVVAGAEKATHHLLDQATRFPLQRVEVLTALSAALSNLLSNVPAVLVFKPLVPRLPDPQQAWLVLAMSSTLAGNLTILGSVANLIVVERARPHVRIGFWDYAKVGIPVTLTTLAIGAWLLR